MKWIQSHTEVVKNSLAVFVVLLVSVVGVKLLLASHAATGATLSMTSSSTSTAPGSDFSVTLAEDSGTNAVNSVQASLSYDATQLQYVSVTEGTAFPTVAATSTDTAGVVRVARATDTPVSGANNIVTVNFKVLATTGSLDLSYDNNFSFVVSSTDNTNILGTSNGLTVPVSSGATAGAGSGAAASMSLSPATGTAQTGSTIAVTVNEDSLTSVVNSVQAVVDYDATQLQYVSMTEGGSFTNIAATDTSTAGVIKVARSVQGGANGISGDNPIVTLTFKVLASSGTAALSIDKSESFVVSSTTNADVLATTAGSTYTIGTAPVSSGSTLSLSPTTGSYAEGSTISVAVKATSTADLTTAEAAINYPAADLQYVSTTEGGVFTTVERTNTSQAGLVDIIRSVPGGNTGVTGTNPLVTINFKVIGNSGTAALTFADASALFDDSGTGTNILDVGSSTTASYTLTGGTVIPTPTPVPAGEGTLSLTPASGSYAPGSTISVAVKATSTADLTTAEAAINYPAADLQYVSTTEGGVFTTVERTNTSQAGLVDIIRSVPGGNTGVTGTNPLVTINFKVIGNSGTAALTFADASALFDDSGTGTNILDVKDSTPASYTISSSTSCASTPSVPGTATRTADDYTTVSFSWTASSAGTGCTLAGYHVYRDGVETGDVTSGTTFTDSGLTAGSNYNYTIAAFDASGHTSATSTAASLTTKVDDMSPTVPIGVTAAAPDSVSVNLAWNPSTDFPNPGGVGVAGYHIYRDNATTPTYSVTSGTTYTDTNVVPGTTYTYTITAYDKLGNESAPSNIVSALTAAPDANCTATPSVPMNLTAGTSTMTTTDLSWTGSTAGASCTLAGYRVYRDGTLLGSSATTSYHDSGLNPNTSYNYTVQSYDTSGHVSALSSATTIVTTADSAAPTAPGNVTATAVSGGRVNIAWDSSTDDVGIASYKIYRGSDLIGTTSSTANSFSDSTVVADTDYSYAVAAVDSAGNASTKTTATPNPVHTPTSTDTTAPTVPTDLNALAVTTTTVVLGWTASTDNIAVAGYHVYRDGNYVGDAITASFSDSGLTPGKTYSYTVKAFDDSGNTSDASDTLSATTQAQAGCIVGDLNCDGVVDIFDLSIMMSHWQEVNVPVKFGDINQDGVVDDSDLTTLLSHLGDKS